MSTKEFCRSAGTALISATALMIPQAAIAQSAPGGADSDAEYEIMVGGAVLFTESPFEGEGTLSNPIPLVRAKFGPAYLDGLEAGVTFEAASGPITPYISAFVAARVTPARDRQKLTADAGIRVGISGELGELSGEYRRDITGEFKGEEYQITYAYPINMGSFTLIPSAQINWLDQETANHMYGVTEGQRAKAISKNREVILPVAPITDKATNLGGTITAIYSMGSGVTLIGVLSGTYFDKSIYQSPAIDQKWESTAILGVAYAF